MIKAIETVYKGYRFRSRLEARWAVFFDALDIKWEYEKEGYDLDGVQYLPDFWLPDLDCWVEIKGHQLEVHHPSEPPSEFKKALALASAGKKPVYIFYGSDFQPFTFEIKTVLSDGGDYLEESGEAYREHGIRILKFYPNGSYSAPFLFTECPFCQTIGIAHNTEKSHCTKEHTKDWLDYEWGFVEHPDPHAEDWWFKDKWDPDHSPRILAAYTAARQARFEHGEKPQLPNASTQIVQPLQLDPKDLHTIAQEVANERDRAYFEYHPNETEYVRPYIKHEMPGEGECTMFFPPDAQVIVTQIRPGFRTREITYPQESSNKPKKQDRGKPKKRSSVKHRKNGKTC